MSSTSVGNNHDRDDELLTMTRGEYRRSQEALAVATLEAAERYAQTLVTELAEAVNDALGRSIASVIDGANDALAEVSKRHNDLLARWNAVIPTLVAASSEEREQLTELKGHVAGLSAGPTSEALAALASLAQRSGEGSKTVIRKATHTADGDLDTIVEHHISDNDLAALLADRQATAQAAVSAVEAQQ